MEETPIPAAAATPTETTPAAPAAQLVAATIEHGRRLGVFALLLDGNALAPRYHDGDLLVIDADALPAPGDAVIVQTRAGYGVMLLNADGDATDAAGGYLPRGAFTVAGVVTESCPAA